MVSRTGQSVEHRNQDGVLYASKVKGAAESRGSALSAKRNAQVEAYGTNWDVYQTMSLGKLEQLASSPRKGLPGKLRGYFNGEGIINP